MGSPFCRYDLRTSDPDAARRFYAEVLGLDLDATTFSGEPSIVAVWLLHEQARKRGAPPHWLGQVGVADVEATAVRLVEQGAERLGPAVRTKDGIDYATLRDPSGAVLAVRGELRTARRSPVAWHQLHTKDLERAWALYAELFGWRQTDTIDVTDPEGGHRMFAWDSSSESVGSMANTARTPGIHPHWLFYFSVADIDAALPKVIACGGKSSAAPIALPNGDRLAPCEDGQGAAFGLFQAATRA